MASARKYAGSGHIKLEDVKAKPKREVIAVVKEEDGNFGSRLVLVFESGRQLSLNKTSVGDLMNEIDDDWDNWIGRVVVIYAGQIKFQGAITSRAAASEAALHYATRVALSQDCGKLPMRGE